MAKHMLPTLTSAGWIKDPKVKMNKLFEYFMASERSQTTLVKTGAHSLKYILANTKDFTQTATMIKDSLTALYAAYFDDVDVETQVNEDDSSTVTIVIYITAMEDGSEYTLQKAVEGQLGDVGRFYNALAKMHYYDSTD